MMMDRIRCVGKEWDNIIDEKTQKAAQKKLSCLEVIGFPERGFCKAIRRFDKSIPIYHHIYWNTSFLTLLCPYRKYISRQHSVNEKALEELPQICQDNLFWKVACKSRIRWDGKYEMELSVNGTTITWILYLILLLFMIIAFFSVSFWGIIGLCAGVLCYYAAFNKTAYKIVVKAAKSLNCDCMEME